MSLQLDRVLYMYVLNNVVININIIMNIVKKSSDKQTYDAWA